MPIPHASGGRYGTSCVAASEAPSPLGGRCLACTSAPHERERGPLPARQHALLLGETARTWLAMLMCMGEVTCVSLPPLFA